MNHHWKFSLLSLLLVFIFSEQTYAQSTYSGNVTGQLVWVEPDTGTVLDTFPLEDIHLQLIAVGRGVIADTVTGPDGWFDFNVPSFTEPDTSVRLRIKIWAINRDTSIMARNTTNTGPRKKTILTNDQVIWVATDNLVEIGRVEAPTDSRAQSVHFANKAKLYVESELAGSFAFPTAPNKSLYIMSPPFGVDANYFLPDQLVGQLNAILIAGGSLPLGLNSFAVSILQLIPVVYTEFTLHPGIYLSDDDSPGSIYHEFGHYLMWNLQGEAWLSFMDAGLSFHDSEANDPSQKMAWTEGFANAFSWIMRALERKNTGRNLEAWDNPALFHLGTDTLKDTTGTILNTAQVLLHGFAGENYVADFIYDLWDGPNNLALLGNGPVSSPDDYEDDFPDEIELTLAQILQPLLNNAASLGPGTLPLNRFGQEASLINNVVQYHDELLATFDDCELEKDINRLSRLDHVHNLDAAIMDSLADRHYINTDIISYPAIVRTRRFKEANSGANFNFKELKNPDPVFYNLDIWGFRDSDDNYNVTDFTDPGKTIELSDDLQIGMTQGNSATLHFNRWLPDNFQTSSNTWGAPAGILVPAKGINLDVEVCGKATFYVSDDGIIELGDSLEDNTAEVRFKPGTSLILGGPAGSGDGPGQLVINDNSRIVIEEGATFVYNTGSEIYLKGQESVLEINGTWIIENNAIFTFSGSGHLETGLPADIGFGNVTMGPNSSIVIKGKGKQEHLIWRVTDGTHVVLPDSQEQMGFHLEDGIVELGAGSEMKVEDARLSFIDIWSHSATPNIRNGGMRSDGNVIVVSGSDFEDGAIGLDIDFTPSTAVASALIGNCEFNNNLAGLITEGANVSVSGGQFAGNLVGWQAVNPDASSVVSGCLLAGNNVGLQFSAPQTLPSPLLICQTTTITQGDTAITQNGFITLNAQCLNIDDHETAVSLSNGASAVLNGSNECSFQTNGPTWLFDGAFLPNLTNGNNQYFSSSSNLFTGTVINNPTVANWNGNHWQATNFQVLSPTYQNMTFLASGLANVMTGTGMSAFSICGSAPKTLGGQGAFGGQGTGNGSGLAEIASQGADQGIVVQVYPQPFTENFNLKISGLEQPLDAELSLLDIQGKVQWSTRSLISNGDVQLKGLAGLPAGIYFLRIASEAATINQRITKQ